LIVFNQNNYGNVLYPAPSYEKATVKSSGCGPTCMAMVVSNMSGKTIDPVAMAAYAIKVKARVSGGTDMNILAEKIGKDYDLNFKTTNNESILLDHLRKGGMAIANVGGNRPGYMGVFSDGGHFIVVAGLSADEKVIVLDPGYYQGKYQKPGRTGKVKMQGNNCICDISVLTMDTANRNPSYWLFTRKEVAEEMKLGIEMPEVKTTLNGSPLDNAVILNVDGKDTTFIPAVSLRNAGMSVEWDKPTSTVIIKGGK